MADENNMQPVRLVYLGRRWIRAEGKKNAFMSYAWTPESTIEVFDENKASRVPKVSTFTNVRLPFMRPGMSWVFDVVLDDDGGADRITVSSFREPASWPRLVDVAYWETLDREAYAKSQEASVTKQLAREGGLDDMLADVRKVYRRLSTMQRSAFLVMVIDKIRSGHDA